ncbi:CG12264-like protein [Haematococcus lacustris]
MLVGGCGRAEGMSAPSRPRGYQGFGSFMVEESVEELIHKPASEYLPPSLPFTLPPLNCSDTTPLGSDQCRQLFLIDFSRWTYLNHGAFGGVCKPAYDEAALWREHCERQPLRFLDRELFPQVVRVMRELATFINAQPQDLVLLPNATTGLNVAIQAAGLQPGDALFMLDIGYGSVKKMGTAACSQAQLVFGNICFPVSSPQDIVAAVASQMPAHTRLAVFDSITSNTALVLPVKELVALCRARGVQVLVDAAHSLMQQEVDLDALDADFYVANCHKWLAGPRGSALLWVHPRVKAQVKPLVVSHGSGAGFTSDFIWDGCRDYAPYLGVSSALAMWRALDLPRCRQYTHQLLQDAVQLLTQCWGTAPLAPLSMCASMALVGLPAQLAMQEVPTSADAKTLQDELHHQHCIEVPVKLVGGQLYVRLSAYIYNRIDDYEKLRDAVASMVDAKAKAAAHASRPGGAVH